MIIPLDVITQINENFEENVIFFSMSTLPRDPAINTYQIRENDAQWYFKGISQLEAHTKYIIAKLAKQNKKVNRIVFLASDATLNLQSEKLAHETAVSFYKKRINQYIGKTGKQNELSNLDLENNNEDVNSKLKEHSVAKYDEDIEFLDVKLSEPTFFWDAVQNILGDSSEDKNINLYIDMQGGDRNSVSQMNAIIELLSDQNVKICGRYANDYNPNKTLHTIREVSNEYRTYELITAMNAFKRYGSGEGLKNFFQSESAPESTRALLSIIEAASNAINLCDVDGFDRAIQRMKRYDETYSNISDKLLDVVYTDIKRDYEPLFNPKYHYVAQIEWCLKKNFLQQAVTIFESKMPDDYVTSGIVYYLNEDDSEEVRQDYLDKCNDEYASLPSYEKYKMIDFNHYFIKYGFNSYNLKDFIKYGVNESKARNSIRKYKAICKKRNSINHALSELRPGSVGKYLHDLHPNDSCWNSVELSDIKTEIEDFLNAWKKLADSVSDDVKRNVLDLG